MPEVWSRSAAVAAVVVLFIVLGGWRRRRWQRQRHGDPGADCDAERQGRPQRQATPAPRPRGRPRAEPITVASKAASPSAGCKLCRSTAVTASGSSSRSDVADEVHVHGYDSARTSRRAASVRFSFPAGIEGVFEIELEDRARADRRAEGQPRDARRCGPPRRARRWRSGRSRCPRRPPRTGSSDAPTCRSPTWLFGWAAAVVLIVSFAALATAVAGAAAGGRRAPSAAARRACRSRSSTPPPRSSRASSASALLALTVVGGLAGCSRRRPTSRPRSST